MTASTAAAIASVSATPDVDRYTGVSTMQYSMSYADGSFAFGVASVEHFNRWVAAGLPLGFDGRDDELAAAHASVGLCENRNGELSLMEGWTWEQHDAAVESKRVAAFLGTE